MFEFFLLYHAFVLFDKNTPRRSFLRGVAHVVGFLASRQSLILRYAEMPLSVS